MEVNDRQVMLDMMLIINYGSKIPAVTLEVQKKVKNSIETMTGLDIVSINIHITGVHFDQVANNKSKGKKSESIN